MIHAAIPNPKLLGNKFYFSDIGIIYQDLRKTPLQLSFLRVLCVSLFGDSCVSPNIETGNLPIITPQSLTQLYWHIV
jgi:hypothetical protein